MIRPYMGDEPCTQVDPELFHPYRTDNEALQVARAVCSTCPVRIACYEYGKTEGLEGVWGGVLLGAGVDHAGRDYLDVELHEGSWQRYSRGECRCKACRDDHRAYRRRLARDGSPTSKRERALKEAHARYNAGDRSPDVVKGHREYDAKVRRALRRKRRPSRAKENVA